MTMTRTNLLLVLATSCVLGLFPHSGSAQVSVHPTGVNVNAHGATSVFLSFGGLAGYVPTEAFWCGALTDAAPALGQRCNPGSYYGALPSRYDRSRAGGGGGFTDIMSIPPSVARRAYQAAERGEVSTFFYVRRFQDPNGGPDQFVAVTCRLTGGGARVPLSLTRVDIGFGTATPVLFLREGETPPNFTAEIDYTGTGVLRGRWEVVRPGEDPPVEVDLLTEASLPLELRGTQRRFTEVGRFNVFLAPTGRFTLEGPDPERLPRDIQGEYQILLRIEASDDKEGDSNLSAVGAGVGLLHNGAVAGFALPSLSYVVGQGGSTLSSSLAGTTTDNRSTSRVRLRFPEDQATLSSDDPVVFVWTRLAGAAAYHLQVETDTGESLLWALLPAESARYVALPWLMARAKGSALRWRVVARDAYGREWGRSDWRTLGVPAGE